MAAAKKVACKARIVGVDPQDIRPSLLRINSQARAALVSYGSVSGNGDGAMQLSELIS